MKQNCALFFILTLLFSCNSVKSKNSKSTVDLIGDKKVDSIVIEKLENNIGSLYRKIGIIKDSCQINQVKCFFKELTTEPVKFFPVYNVIFYEGDSLLGFGFSHPNYIKSYGQTYQISNKLGELITLIESQN